LPHLAVERAGTLTALLDDLARRHGGATALWYRGLAVTYAGLAAESRRVARGLRDLGVRADDRVALWLPNTPAWIAAFFACARLGAIALSTNTRFRSAEMSDILGRSGASFLLYWPGFRGIDFDAILGAADASSLRGLRGLIAYREDDAPVGPAGPAGLPVHAYRTLAACAPWDGDHAAPDRGCVMFTTSGTTRAPKFVLHHQAAIVTHLHDVARGFGYAAPGAVGLSVLPLCGVYGFATALAPLAAGAPFPMTSRFDVPQTLDLIRQHRVTNTNLTGDMIAALLAEARDADAFATIRFCGCGTGSTVHAASGEAKGLRITGLYGSSELQALFSHQDEVPAIEARSQGGGRPVSPLASVRTRDVETGAILPHGESGMLEIRAPSQLAEYFGNPEATAEAFTDDGFFRTGDLGCTVADGRFVYLSRMGDSLRLSGFLVSPVQIEAVVLEYPGIAACQVVGVEGPGGAKPYAFYLGHDHAAVDEAALTAFCRERMARYKVPARFVRLDAFPVTNGANGTKVQKARLREMATALTGGAA
jgi:fatty-acyl-CoA synthase